MKRILKLSIITTLLAFAVSCDGMLNTEPTVAVSSDQIITTASGMDAVLTSAYDRLRSESLYRYWIPAGPEVLADNSELHPINSGRFSSQAENAFGSHFTTGVWSTAYRLINEANIIIDGAGATQTSQSHRDRLMGEAHFLRGLAYHELLRVYSYEPNHPLINEWNQGVIIRTTPTLGLSDADLRPRSSVIEGYEQAERDFLAAIPLLQNNDQGNVYFADEATAHAGLARLYLYWERWEDALNHAQQAISTAKGSLTDFSEHENIFDVLPNPESIFELSFDNPHGSSGSLNAVTNPPPGWFDALPSAELLSLYEEDDLRNNLFKVHTDDYPFIIKYSGTVGQNTDHIPVFRVAEMILIQAEAHYELNNEAAATEALELLRSHRGLAAYENAPSGIELFEEIYDERRRELAFEGHRWFDLKRRAMDVPKPQVNLNPAVPFDDVRILAPLSATQVENNPNLDQNPGY
ncbi:MAG: RagB/SusD family nutrient uptake outer membrane protein [Balneolaceae bacterium]|nr:MAG: RagB/SusD family nutrient uptake outer membrane protein [Balneolaceae bacterium]